MSSQSKTRNHSWKGYLPKGAIVMGRVRASVGAVAASQVSQKSQETLIENHVETGVVSSADAVSGADAAAKHDSLERIAAELVGCSQCKLCQGRRTIVVGEGNPRARLMWIGEGPGETEDELGRPFVGKAGQLLDRMIEAMGSSRADVYIANVVKCRPPENRNPEPDEIEACAPYLRRQIEAVKPEVIIALGKFAAQTLLAHTLSPGEGILKIRGRWFESVEGIPVMPTLHPAYLLRNPDAKKDAWSDLLQVSSRLGWSAKGATRTSS